MDSPCAISKIFQSCLNHPISKLSKSLEKKLTTFGRIIPHLLKSVCHWNLLLEFPIHKSNFISFYFPFKKTNVITRKNPQINLHFEQRAFLE